MIRLNFFQKGKGLSSQQIFCKTWRNSVAIFCPLHYNSASQMTLEYGVVVARRPLTPTVLVQFRLLLPKQKGQVFYLSFFGAHGGIRTHNNAVGGHRFIQLDYACVYFLSKLYRATNSSGVSLSPLIVASLPNFSIASSN